MAKKIDGRKSHGLVGVDDGEGDGGSGDGETSGRCPCNLHGGRRSGQLRNQIFLAPG